MSEIRELESEVRTILPKIGGPKREEMPFPHHCSIRSRAVADTDLSQLQSPSRAVISQGGSFRV